MLYMIAALVVIILTFLMQSEEPPRGKEAESRMHAHFAKFMRADLVSDEVIKIAQERIPKLEEPLLKASSVFHRVWPIILEHSHKYNPLLSYAIGKIETSAWFPDAMSTDGALGVWQITRPTGLWLHRLIVKGRGDKEIMKGYLKEFTLKYPHIDPKSISNIDFVLYDPELSTYLHMQYILKAIEIAKSRRDDPFALYIPTIAGLYHAGLGAECYITYIDDSEILVEGRDVYCGPRSQAYMISAFNIVKKVYEAVIS